MSLVVYDMSTKFNIVVDYEDEKLAFTFRQLTYKEKNKIATFTTKFEQGQAVIDGSLNCFYVLKYGLLDVEGINKSDGSKWTLEKTKEDDIEVNTDEAIDTLLNSKISNGLIWAANSMLEGIPDKITNPLTGREIQGVEVVLLKDSVKKKS